MFSSKEKAGHGLSHSLSISRFKMKRCPLQNLERCPLQNLVPTAEPGAPYLCDMTVSQCDDFILQARQELNTKLEEVNTYLEQQVFYSNYWCIHYLECSMDPFLSAHAHIPTHPHTHTHTHTHTCTHVHTHRVRRRRSWRDSGLT